MRVDRAHGRRLVVPLAIVALLSSLAAAPVAAVRAPSGQGDASAPQDAEPLPDINLTASSATVKEGDAGTVTLSFVIVIDRVSGSPITFDWATQDGSATVADGDYIGASGTGLISAGGTLTTVSVTVNGDTRDENPFNNYEYLSLSLTNIAGTSSASTSTLGYIYDDDVQVVPDINLTASSASVKEGDAGTVSLSFVISLDQTAPADVTFDWATQDGSATAADSDYVSDSGTRTITAGTTFTTIDIVVNGDTRDENPFNNYEYLGLSLTNIAGTTSASTSTLGYIYDDDAQALPDINLTAPSATVKEGNAGTVTLSFVIGIDRVSGSDVTFDWATQDGSATVGDGDYAAGSGAGTIAAGATFTTIAVTVIGDAADEGDYEYLGLSLTNIIGTTSTSTFSLGYIYDDDGAGAAVPLPIVYIDNPSVVEGDAGTKTLTYTVWLDRLATGTVSVNRATQDSGATAPADYTGLSTAALTWTAGQQVKTVSVTTKGDTIDEGYSEGILLNLTTPSGVTIWSSSGSGTILDDDETPVPLATVYVSNPSVVEGDVGTRNLTFTVWLDRLATGTVSVNRATQDSSATAPADYTSLSTSALTWTAGQQVKTVSVTVNGDLADEGYSEGILLNLTTPSGVTIWSSSGSGTILDDDETAVPVPTVYVTNPTILEGNSGTKTLTFAVWLDRLATTTVSVNRATQDSSATAPADYTALSSAALTWTAGQQTKTVGVTVKGDCSDEGLSEALLLSLSAPSGATIWSSSGSGTIWDDDLASCSQLSIDDPSTTEGTGGTKNLTFTVTRSGVTTGTTTVNYTTNPGTATAVADYATTSGSLSFTAGQTSKPISVPLVTDSVDELDEQLTMVLSSPSGGALLTKATGSGTILNDDDPFISIADATKDPEGSGGGTSNLAFSVSLDHVSLQDVSVGYQTSDGTASAPSDYTTTTGTLTITTGQLSGIVNVPIVRDDTDEPATEVFTIDLSSPSNGSLGDASATGTIVDDDGAPIPNLTIGDASKNPEGNSGSTALTFPVTLSATSLSDVTVEYSTSAGTATPGADFTSVSAGLVTIPAGQTTVNATVLVDGDLLDEANETLTVSLADPTGATILDGTASGTIVDDDATPTVTIAPASTTEGDVPPNKTLSFTVTLSAASGRTVTVDYATSASGASPATSGTDYTATTGTLSIPAGTLTKTIGVVVVGDTAVEPNETFSLTISSPSNAVLGTAVGTGTIIDDDGTTLLVSVLDKAKNPEGNVAGSMSFTVALSNPASGTVTVNYASSDGTATSPADYGSVAGTLTFSAGQGSKTITVSTVGDLTDENDETFFMTLSAPTGGATIGDATAVGTIVDDDAAPTLSVTDASTTEGNSGTKSLGFTITLSQASGKTVSVDFTTTDIPGGAVAGDDYTPKSGSLTFAAGQTSKTIGVLIAGDTTPEPNETFAVDLVDPVAASLADGSGLGTIVDDDNAATPTLSIADATRNPEGNAAGTLTFTVTLSPSAASTVTVHYATSTGTATAADFSSTSGTLTFTPGITTRTIGVPIVGDLLDEATESFTVALSSPVNAGLGDASATGAIVDDDTQPTLSVADVAINEPASGTANLTFTAHLSAASGQTITAEFAASDVTAKAGADYVDAVGVLTWAPGQTDKTVAVSVKADTVCELAETLAFKLSDVVNATPGDVNAIGTINAQSCPVASIANSTIAEPDSGTTATVSLTVTLSPAPTSTVSVDYATADGTAVQPGDYTAKSGTLSFTSGQTSKTIAVTVKGDATDEQAQTFTVLLSDPVGLRFGDSSATVTITDCTIYGTNGSDSLTGTSGNDVICGLGGNDTLSPLGGNDDVRGGLGADTVSYATSPNQMAINLGASSATGWGTDSLSSIENATGGPKNDTITGSNGPNDVQAGAGDDLIKGNDGDDDLYGQDGDDELWPASGVDHLFGGNGEDVVAYADAPAGVSVNLSSGAATGDGSDSLSLIEDINGSGHADTLNGNAGPNKINGGNGNDTINGAAGADTLTGNNDEDTIHGGDGVDSIAGGNDADTLYGDTGNDTITGGLSPTAADKDYINGGTGTDTCFDNTGVQDTKVNCEIFSLLLPPLPIALLFGTSLFSLAAAAPPERRRLPTPRRVRGRLRRTGRSGPRPGR